MRMTRLVAKTLRDVPSDAEAISHQLLIRAGYIRRISSGIYSYLPLGFRVLRRIQEIIRQEFDATGAQEVLLPTIQPIELWDETKRSESMDDVLMRLSIRGAEFVLGPTHEEAVIATVVQDLGSYRDLPAMVYQIQTKFRDEARPRFGLLRTREFIMADAYSFDVDQSAMRDAYRSMFDAYCRIFERLGIQYFPVEADAGSIGGDVNHEFMVPAAIGEDYFALCSSCGYKANIEAAIRLAKSDPDESSTVMPMTEVYTGDTPSVDAAISKLAEVRSGINSSQMIKAIVLRDASGSLALALVPGDRKVRVPNGYESLPNEDFANYDFLHLGFIGPFGIPERGILVFADKSLDNMKGYTTGANRVGYHVLDAVLGRDFFVDEFLDLVVVEDGDACPRCGGDLALVRAVEAGHTFQLGLTYPKKIDSARYSAEDGSAAMYYMGCYGIGVSRLPAVIAEVSNDAQGLIWPISVAPFHVHIVALAYQRNLDVKQASDLIYDGLLGLGFEVLLDDRDTGIGVKLNDADLMGMPIQVVVGPKGIATQTVEVKIRSSLLKEEIVTSDAVRFVAEQIQMLYKNLNVSR